ncbi:hypothetical protein BH24ACT3_BH24ACT3_13970 [soil metagenome]
MLPGTPPLEGLHTLRTLDACAAIAAAFSAGPRRVAVVGGGFIGAEVAATARSRGLEVTLVEALPVPLGRALGAQVGAVCAAIHADHGVDVRLGVGVDGFDGDDRVERVRPADGTTVDADVVFVGVGVAPTTAWLEGSGLTLDDGVLCDETCLAAPGVVAAGDVARWRHPGYDAPIRVEHWDNAAEQGAHAARRLLAGDGRAEAYAPVPWVWSDQYDRKIQMAGRPGPRDEMRVVDGSLAERRFVAVYGRGGRVTGVVGMNRPSVVTRYRMLLAQGPVTWDEATTS